MQNKNSPIDECFWLRRSAVEQRAEEEAARRGWCEEDRDLLQAVYGAAAQVGVLLLGGGEAVGHGLEVGGVCRVRPAAVEPDLRGWG